MTDTEPRGLKPRIRLVDTEADIIAQLAIQAEARHPAEGRSFAALWQAARIEQKLWPVSFVWRGAELTPAALRAAFPPPQPF